MDRHELDHKMVLGHDLSTLQQLEDVGRTFSDDGRVQPVEQIVAYHGATYIRERLWVNPPIPYNDLSHILIMARRIKTAGLKLLKSSRCSASFLISVAGASSIGNRPGFQVWVGSPARATPGGT